MCGKTIVLLPRALASSVRVAMAINDPPYYLFPYVPDATDKPPLYYTKVCLVGKTEEKDAEYVVIGVWFPWIFQGVVPGYSGELVISEKIDGLSVRKIMPAAFSMCQSLTSMHIPSTVRKIGVSYGDRPHLRVLVAYLVVVGHIHGLLASYNLARDCHCAVDCRPFFWPCKIRGTFV